MYVLDPSCSVLYKASPLCCYSRLSLGCLEFVHQLLLELFAATSNDTISGDEDFWRPHPRKWQLTMDASGNSTQNLTASRPISNKYHSILRLIQSKKRDKLLSSWVRLELRLTRSSATWWHLTAPAQSPSLRLRRFSEGITSPNGLS